jgi:hypothetical protein
VTNRYVRFALAATRAQVPDPELLVEAWLDRLGDILDGTAAGGSACRAYDLLALWAKLRRVRPGLAAALAAGDELARADERLREAGKPLAQLALTVPNPGAWLQEAKMLAASYRQVIDPEERADFAAHLLSDLDDADLACYAARRLGVEDAALNRELAACGDWLARHADCFLAASVPVQALGLALRPDLAAFDAALAETAEKYVRVLDALEIAEAGLSFADQPLLDRQTAEELVRNFQVVRWLGG